MTNTLEITEKQSGIWETYNAPKKSNPNQSTRVQAPAKILIVDDEVDIVMSLAKRLRFAGYDIASASDGVEATKMAMRTRPDVILLDIGMPCGDGHTIAARIRANTSTMFSQIIFLTARAGQADRQKAMAAGAFGYLTKPFKSEELLSMIESALADSQS